MVTHICSFSALDLPKKLWGSDAAVMAALKEAGRVSCFEIEGRLAITIDRLFSTGKIRRTGGNYPWVEVEVND